MEQWPTVSPRLLHQQRPLLPIRKLFEEGGLEKEGFPSRDFNSAPGMGSVSLILLINRENSLTKNKGALL